MTSAFQTAAHDHVAMRVADFDATVAWYADVLGSAVEREWAALSYVGEGIRAAYLRLNDAAVEVVGGGEPAPSRAAPGTAREPFAVGGYSHLCLRVADLDAAAAELRAKDVAIYAGPNTSDVLNRRFLHFRDLNGLPVEFVEHLTPR